MTRIASITFAAALGLTSLALPTFLTGSRPAGRTDTPANLESTEHIVDSLMSAISRSKRPLPAWALDAASKAVMHWRLHRLSRKTQEIEKEVTAVLRIVVDIKDQVEAGRAMSERETRFARAALEAHDRRLDDLTSRVDAIEQGTRVSEARIAKLEAHNKVLMAENKALRASNSELTRRFLRDRCGAGRKRGVHGCVDDPE